MEIWLAYEEDMIAGAVTDGDMAEKWTEENSTREIYEIPLLDKTFAKMTVEYNTKYEQ